MSQVVEPSLCKWKCLLTVDPKQIKEAGWYALLLTGPGDYQGARVPDWWSIIQSDGGDICASSDAAGQNQLNVEVVPGSIDLVNKKCRIYISVYVSPADGGTLYVWYGSNAGTLTQPAASAAYGSQAVWDRVGNMSGVWHIGPGSETANCYDSTANGTNGKNYEAIEKRGRESM